AGADDDVIVLHFPPHLPAAPFNRHSRARGNPGISVGCPGPRFREGDELAYQWHFFAHSFGANEVGCHSAPSARRKSTTTSSRVRVCQRRRRAIGSFSISGTTLHAVKTGPGLPMISGRARSKSPISVKA